MANFPDSDLLFNRQYHISKQKLTEKKNSFRNVNLRTHPYITRAQNETTKRQETTAACTIISYTPLRNAYFHRSRSQTHENNIYSNHKISSPSIIIQQHREFTIEEHEIDAQETYTFQYQISK